MFKKIMIATDGSGPSYRAAKLGLELARTHGSQVVAVYVVDVSRLIQLPGYTGIPGLKNKLLGLMLEEGKYVTEEIEKDGPSGWSSLQQDCIEGASQRRATRYSLESHNGSVGDGKRWKERPEQISSGKRGGEGGTALKGSCHSGSWNQGLIF